MLISIVVASVCSLKINRYNLYRPTMHNTHTHTQKTYHMKQKVSSNKNCKADFGLHLSSVIIDIQIIWVMYM